MKRSVIALVGAGAIVLAVGGYAVGTTRDGGASGSGRSAACAQAEKEFTGRAGRLREQMEREYRDEDYANSINPDMESTQVRILGLIVDQNPACFDAGTRAAATYLRQHRAEGEEDAAACELAGVPAERCSIAVG
ncbi:hypothetical protein ACIRBZ_09915 [Streptomyces sp. NPDC094038]|uniref:hypothetical protein n=1 Tax=Streptomyces sp. NPDC094038 TaxID=3366055 RepID=UPI003825CAF2